MSTARPDPMQADAPVLTRTVRWATLPVTLWVQAASAAAVVAPTVAAPRLLERLSLGPTAVGIYIALLYLGAMVATQVGPVLVRRWGPILTSQVALGLSGLGVLLLTVPDVRVAALGAVLNGMGYGPITPASSQMLARTTDPRHFSLVFSIKQTGVPVGGVIAGLMVPALITRGSADLALATTAALCALGVLAAWPLRRALDHAREPAAGWPGWSRLVEPLRFVLTHPVLRGVAACSFAFSMVQVSLTSYLVSFVNGELGWTLVAAGAALAAAQTAGVVGRIGWGLVADRWLGARRTLLLLGAGSLLCGVALPVLAPLGNRTALLILLCLYGAMAIGWNGVYLALVARLVPQAQAAQATGGTLFFTFLGVVVGPPVFGAAGAALGSLAWSFALMGLPMAVVLVVMARARWPG
jgi:MFS family permease